MNEPNASGQAQAPEIEHYPLDETIIVMLSEITQQMQTLQAQSQGALVLFIRQHKLVGNWKLAENGKELVKAPALPVTAAN